MSLHRINQLAVQGVDVVDGSFENLSLIDNACILIFISLNFGYTDFVIPFKFWNGYPANKKQVNVPKPENCNIHTYQGMSNFTFEGLCLPATAGTIDLSLPYSRFLANFLYFLTILWPATTALLEALRRGAILMLSPDIWPHRLVGTEGDGPGAPLMLLSGLAVRTALSVLT